MGEQESSRKTVNVRTRDNQRRGERQLDDLLETLHEERSTRQVILHSMTNPPLFVHSMSCVLRTHVRETKKILKIASHQIMEYVILGELLRLHDHDLVVMREDPMLCRVKSSHRVSSHDLLVK